jgi:hypothetical protein
MSTFANANRATMHTLLTLAGEFLHAFVESGNPAADPTLHPVMGPNGAQIWTAGIGVDRRQPPSVGSITVTDVPDELVVPRRHRNMWRRTGTVSA